MILHVCLMYFQLSAETPNDRALALLNFQRPPIGLFNQIAQFASEILQFHPSMKIVEGIIADSIHGSTS